MELHDVIIVGAGPAGSTAGRVLISAGFDVLVIDKDTFPREKPCAGWISPMALELSGNSPKEYEKKGTLTSFSSVVIWDTKNRPREVRFKKTLGYGIIRSEFDTALLEEIKGVSLREGVRISSIERDDDGVILNDSLKAKVVIGAGGHNCPVAKRFAEIKKDEKIIAAVVSETRVGKDEIRKHTEYSDIPEIIFNDDFSGYGWYFPKGDYLNIGIGSTITKDLNSYKNRLLEKLDKIGRLPDPEGFPPFKFRGHVYKLNKLTPRRLVSDRVLFTGDAGGMAYNMSGEGIGPAILSGFAAAQTIIDAGGDYSAENLSIYQKLIYSKFGRPYPDFLLHLASSVPETFFHILKNATIGTSFGRREIIAKRWFFRD